MNLPSSDRDEVSARLLESFARVETQGSRALLLTGRLGTGKTSLVTRSFEAVVTSLTRSAPQGFLASNTIQLSYSSSNRESFSRLFRLRRRRWRSRGYSRHGSGRPDFLRRPSCRAADRVLLTFGAGNCTVSLEGVEK